MAFSKEQLEKLQAELSADKVRTRNQGGRGVSYVEGYSVIDSCNEIFGFGEWDYEIVGGIDGIKTVKGGSVQLKDSSNSVIGTTTGYLSKAVVKVTVKMEDGTTVSRTDVGLCVPAVSTRNGMTEPTPDAIETSEKGAVTDALKRALRSFGSQFGNSLYDKDSNLHQGTGFNNSNTSTVSTGGRQCPSCGGSMERRSGVKGDKQWSGWFCENNKVNGCKPIWND